MVFKTTSRSLSKLAENTKIRLPYDFKRFLLGNKTVFINFLKITATTCATNLAQISDMLNYEWSECESSINPL